MLWRKRENLKKMKGALLWPLVGSLISGGISHLTGKKKKEEPLTYDTIDLKSLTDTSTGKTLNDRILAALNQGQNIGYPAEYINRSTSPFVASRESGFTENELPALNAEYGSRGLSRSTLAGRDINKAYAQKERDINEIMANAYTQNLNQSKTDIARYENLADTFSQNQTALENQELLYNAGINNTNAKAAYDTNATNDANAYSNLNTAIGSALGALNTGIGNTTSSNSNLLNIIKQILGSRSSPYVGQ
jgi:hypothetical protein